ncbi:MAG: precorrin-8X methylmutase [Nitrospirae bacterium]|nr:precorrin-8X methylmutase [Nitrospirota bacterium]
MSEVITDPRAIEKKSFEIIAEILGGRFPGGPEKDVVMRVVHATADPDFADAMAFSSGAAEAGVLALRAGCNIVTDVMMLRAGVARKKSGEPDRVYCFISDTDVAEDAKASGGTRAAAAMRKAVREGVMDGAVVAIGNAPTALYEVMRLVQDEGIRPALIVGVPVGFVGAAESKDELLGLAGVPFITCRGRKGGSPVGAAVLNALLKLSTSV